MTTHYRSTISQLSSFLPAGNIAYIVCHSRLATGYYGSVSNKIIMLAAEITLRPSCAGNTSRRLLTQLNFITEQLEGQTRKRKQELNA